MASLHITGGPTAGTRVALEREDTVIGRGIDCDLIVPSVVLSRQHARITRRGDRFVLQDLDSRGGTYLNRRQIRGLSPLRDGDLIQIAVFQAVFESPAGSLTEEGWLNSSNSQAMLSWLKARGGTSERKLRLFAAACCRQFGLLESRENPVAAVALAERYAEGEARLDPVPAGHAREHPVWSADAWTAAADTARLAAETAAARLVWLQPSGAGDFPRRRPEEELWAAADAAEGLLCGLVRDLWGNSFRPPQLDRFLLGREDGILARLAQAAYDDRLPSGTLDPDRLAVLGDALEEAGCTDAELLAHLRRPGPHYRGCFALDPLLGKS
jgi:hypothetical protein